jgi:hypothetical protein
MKLTKTASLLTALLLGAFIINAQTADEIINKHLEAIGGRENLQKIKSVRLESDMQMSGNELSSVTTVLDGKGLRSETDFNGQKMIQVYTDKDGWTVSPMNGSPDPQPMNDDQYKAGQEQIYVVSFLNYADRGAKLELDGQEKVGDVNTYKVKMTNKDSVSTTYYFDPSTYYVIQITKSVEMMGQPVDLKIAFSDFKKLDSGMVMPQQIDTDFGQFSLTAKIKKVGVNVPVDESIFQMGK